MATDKKLSPIFLDYQSTTPVDSRVLAAMLPYFSENFGNPASKSHQPGHIASAVVEAAREQVARAIQAKPQEIVFTSGATEAINLAIKGVAWANRDRGNHFITVATEHKAVLDCFAWLKRNGFETTVLPVNSDGLLDPSEVHSALRPETVMVSVMAANNEIGVIQPFDEIAQICRAKGVHFFTDATQALGKMPISVSKSPIDLLCGSAHKIYGPKGIGFLYARRSNPRVRIEPLIHGGGHENGLRSGTLPTPLIVGLGEALAVAVAEMNITNQRLGGLRDIFLAELRHAIPGIKVNGSMECRLSGNLNLSIPDVDAEALVVSLNQLVAFSTGSACTSSSISPSHVLSALGVDQATLRSSVRFSIGSKTNEEEIMRASAAIIERAIRLASLAR